MIYTVTLNPAIDYMIEPEAFSLNAVNRYQNAYYTAGGKGVNVSLLLSSFGVQNTAIGAAAGFSGQEIVRILEEKGGQTDFIFLESMHSRINIKICAGGEETDFNGTGPHMDDSVIDRIIEKLKAAEKEDTVVLAGSLPDGISDNAYERIIMSLRDSGARIIVDAVGSTLLKTLPHHPFMVKPNAEELGELFDTRIESLEDAKHYGRRLCEIGAENVIVSLEELGAVLIESSGDCRHYPTLKGRLVSAVGAGDSLVAGFIYGMEREEDIKSAVEWGVAAGTATAFKKGIATAEEVFEVKHNIDFNVYKRKNK